MLEHPSSNSCPKVTPGHTYAPKCGLAVPRPERPQVVAMLREAGMSQRAIAATVNVTQPTVRMDLKQLDKNLSPQPRSTTDVDPEDQAFIAQHGYSTPHRVSADTVFLLQCLLGWQRVKPC